MPRPKLPANTARTKNISVRISSKLSYLTEIGAREHQVTVSSFIEQAIKRALTPESMRDDEPNTGEPVGPRQSLTLYNEGLWDAIESDRLFLLATLRPDLLTPNEQRFFKLYSMYMESILQPITIESFRKFYNSDGIDTKHLSESDE